MSDLQLKLEAIKELKAEYHIGSQAALFVYRNTRLGSEVRKGIEKLTNETNDLFGLDIFGLGKVGLVNSIVLDLINTKDSLYDRLKNEQLLHRDDMQRVYLARFIENFGIDDLDHFEGQIIVFEEGPRLIVKTKEELDWLKLISRRHQNWLRKYLES